MSEQYYPLIEDLLNRIPKDESGLLKMFRRAAKRDNYTLPKKAEVFKAYQEMVESQAIEANPFLESLLKKRGIRTLSGVAPITVMTAPLSCPKNCLYCPTEKNMPKSYLSNQPAAMRAVLSDFDPHTQTTTRLRALKRNGHSTDKIEMIINGGTWSAHPKSYQTWYIKRIFDACNHYDPESNVSEGIVDYHKGGKSIISQKLINRHEIETDLYSPNDQALRLPLLEAQKINETTENRIIGITLETRPDYITPEELARMRMLGATKIEVGVQTLYPDVVELNRREQNLDDVIRATKLMKDAGFKVAYHMMPGMYGSTPDRDVAMFKELYENPDFKPDFLKIYPCLVVKDSDLYDIYKKGDFKPYSTEVLVDTLVRLQEHIPRYTRIARLHRDIPTESVEGGCSITNLREYVDKEVKARNLKCQDIRAREARGITIKNPERAVLNVDEFPCNDTTEYFLSFDTEDDEHLLAFLRLRLPSPTNEELVFYIPELKDAAIVRELHTYGVVAPLHKDQGKTAVQHLGFGKRLMAKAEEIAKAKGAKRMAVISGIGVRKYYEKLGYRLDGTYMVKDL